MRTRDAGASVLMGKITGFLEIDRNERKYTPVTERLKNYREFVIPLSEKDTRDQAARCMNCGIPYGHGTGSVAPGSPGCPVNNQIPDWNDLVYQGNWEEAARNLHSTNNFPEFTGRICPAPCEASCTLNIDDNPVTIKTIECAIVDRGWEEGWIAPQPPARRTGKRVAVVGSGPAGMACAQQLARAGHSVTLFEKNDRIGGLLRYGIPDFKMEKHLIDRRVEQMAAEGVTFRTSVRVGVDVPGDEVRREFDGIVRSCGATKPRDLPVPGRELPGIHFAMEFLPQQNKVNAGDQVDGQILATGKRVVILGGGDTGSDCLGTSNRQGAVSVHQFELLPEPPKDRPPLVWPNWPMILRSSSSHEEGVIRDFSINTKAFLADAKGRVRALRAVRLDWQTDNGRPVMKERPGSEFELPCELVLLALGFLGPETGTVISQLGCELTQRGNVKAGPDYQTTVPGVFACGDARRGQSLGGWAIW